MNKSHSLWFICLGLLSLGFGVTTTVKADTITFVAATPVINGTTTQQGPFLSFTVGGKTAQTPIGVFTIAGQGVVDFRVPNADGSFPDHRR